MRTTGSKLKKFIPHFVIIQKLKINNSILLTFDDGPDPVITPQVLDILGNYNARGLFFVPGGRISKAPDLLEIILRNKHGVENHSYSHKSCSELSYTQIVDEINQCSDAIYDVTGHRTTLFRPPMGVVTPSLLFAARKCNHKIVRWSFDSGEYSYLQGRNVSELANNFINHGISDQTILLSHDDNENIPGFLKIILPELIERGYDLKSGIDSLAK